VFILKVSRTKILTFPIRIALIILVYGVLFKVMHWLYAKQLILLGSGLIVLLYSLRFLYKKEKQTLDYVKLGLVLVWVFNYCIKGLHLFNIPYVLDLVLLILFVWWLITEGFTYFIRRKLKNSGVLKLFYYGFSITSLALIIIGVLFKIQHWPYGSLIFTFGSLLLSMMLIVDYFAIQKQPNR